MVEPDAVDTGLFHTILGSFEKMEADGSLDDIEKGITRKWLKVVREKCNALTPSDVAGTLLTILDAEKPLLRYQIPEAVTQHFETVLADPTGETGVLMMITALGVD